MCVQPINGPARSQWMDNRQGTAATVEMVGDQVQSEFTIQEVDVAVTYSLDCTTLHLCYTFTNVSDEPVDINLTAYLDPDLTLGTEGYQMI